MHDRYLHCVCTCHEWYPTAILNGSRYQFESSLSGCVSGMLSPLLTHNLKYSFLIFASELRLPGWYSHRSQMEHLLCAAPRGSERQCRDGTVSKKPLLLTSSSSSGQQLQQDSSHDHTSAAAAKRLPPDRDQTVAAAGTATDLRCSGSTTLCRYCKAPAVNQICRAMSGLCDMSCSLDVMLPLVAS